MCLARCASTAPAVTPAVLNEQISSSLPHVPPYNLTQPPSHRPPEKRTSQLVREYTSLIRTSPLIVLFQHNNLQSTEWAAIRRELTLAMRRVDEQIAAESPQRSPPLEPHVRIQIIQTSIFEVALRVVDFFRPDPSATQSLTPTAVDGQTQTTAKVLKRDYRDDPSLLHDLSRTVQLAILHKKGKHELSTILAGPLAVLSFPQVSPEHLKAALSILAPKLSGFSAPSRKTYPGYHEMTVQDGLQKLMLLAARVDGNILDVPQINWVGSIQGGIDGLRAQLVTSLQSLGAGVTSTLEGAGNSLYFTLESRRTLLEEEQKGPAPPPEEERNS